MKAQRASTFLAAAMLLALLTDSLFGEDWTTRDGKTYKSVTVLKAEPDAVTILCSDGGALIPLEKLPADLQKRFNYDPDKAKAAAEARAKSDAESAKALQIEAAQAAKIQQDKLAQDKAEEKRLAELKAKNGHHDGMPAEPDILEINQKSNGDPLQKPKD